MPADEAYYALMQERIENSVARERASANMTQEQLAARVGVTRQTIIAVERGNYTPSVLLALRFAHAFKTTVEKLFWIQR